MTPAPTRRGACPSLSAPMPTGDGLLARLNPVGGSLCPRQLAETARAAGRFGNGMLEITARGSLQIRGLTQSTAPRLAAFVDGLGVEVRVSVSVETGPLGGLDPDEITDPRPLAASIREGIDHLGFAARLGPKVSVVVDGGGRSMLDGIKADVRLTAGRAQGRVLWQLALAGDAAGATVIRVLPEREACVATLERLSAIAALGKAGRAKDLLPGAETRRPDTSWDGRSDTVQPFGAIITLIDSRFALRVGLPFGAIDAATLAGFADTLETLGVAELRLCPGRSLLPLSATRADAMAVLECARAAGLIVDAGDPRLAVVACAGAPACASAHYATRMLAERIVREAPDLLVPDTRLHLSGCGKRCAEPTGPSIALIGGDEGCSIVVNGTSVPSTLQNYLARHGNMDVHDRRTS